MRRGGLLMDVTSIKEAPVKAMLESTKASVVGTHPMFGPSVHSLQGQRVVLCLERRLAAAVPGRSKRALSRRIAELLSAWTGERFSYEGEIFKIPEMELRPAPKSTDLASRTAKALFGDDAWVTMTHPLMGAEDFSYILQKAPGAMVWLLRTAVFLKPWVPKKPMRPRLKM